jgi:hypothetical protein
MRSTAFLSSPFVALALTATLVAGAGCKSSQEKAGPRPSVTQNGTQVQLVEGGLVMTTDAGTVALGENAKIPDDFPKTVPLYPGAKVNMASRSAAEKGKAAWSLSLETGDEQPKVVAFYASAMAASTGAFKKGSDLALGDTQMTVWQGAQLDVTLMISAGAENQTAITMTVTGK